MADGTSFASAFVRAQRGLRAEGGLYVASITSLSVAFLCLAALLLALTNLNAVAEHWGQSGRMTVYLADGARQDDVAQLCVVLESLAETRSVTPKSSVEARAEFLSNLEEARGLESLSSELFPASLEVALEPGVDIERASRVAERVASLRGVSEVETYRGFFEKLQALLSAGHGVSVALALFVSVCAMAVIGNTIRLAVARRRDEIEVMKLCGATNGFVGGPLVIEGAVQGFAAAVLSMLLLGGGYAWMRGDVDRSLHALTGIDSVFLSPLTLTAMLLGGALLGAVSSAVSLHRYLRD